MVKGVGVIDIARDTGRKKSPFLVGVMVYDPLLILSTAYRPKESVSVDASPIEMVMPGIPFPHLSTTRPERAALLLLVSALLVSSTETVLPLHDIHTMTMTALNKIGRKNNFFMVIPCLGEEVEIYVPNFIEFS